MFSDGDRLRNLLGLYGERMDAGDHGTWRFAERRFDLDLPGDLSRHWGGPT